MQKKIITSLLYLLLANSTFVQAEVLHWDIRHLALSPQENIKLKDANGRVIQTVSARQMQQLSKTNQAISRAAELQTHFILFADNKAPNAFAGYASNSQPFIAVNFAMLKIIGNNVDMMAALIGHELAHLKLNHHDEAKRATQGIKQSRFISSSATRYSRDNEREADYLGIIWAIETHHQAEGAVALQEVLYNLSKKKPSGFGLTHPSNIERITVLKALARRFNN